MMTPKPHQDALTQIVIAAVKHRRPVVVNWHQRVSDETWFPIVGLVIDGVRWSAYFFDRPRGWALRIVCTSTREHRGLRRTLDAVANDRWS